MRWQRGRRSSNIQDRRGVRVARGAKVGGGLAIVLAIAALLFGNDLKPLLSIISDKIISTTQTQQALPESSENNTAKEFVSVVLADTEDVWTKIFKQKGSTYKKPTLILYSDMVESACGVNSAQSGPFYCPGDAKVYLDLNFLNELQRLGAEGDFAIAYVISHEIGHHVQNLVGVATQVRNAQMQSGKAQANSLSVMAELQADCYAGVWAHHADKQRNILEPGDIEEGINAASMIGDDRLQRSAGRRVYPESFTHGSSRQRMQWLQIGLNSGDIDSCDTFTSLGAG